MRCQFVCVEALQYFLHIGELAMVVLALASSVLGGGGAVGAANKPTQLTAQAPPTTYS